MKKRFVLSLLCTVAGVCAAEKGWWQTEPVSLIQTNLRETDSALDPDALVEAIRDFPANTILFSMGGIVAHYPTKVQYHYPSAYLPAGRDLVGDVLTKAHASGMRVICRFDFSRARKEVYDAHPEWFYTRKDGGAVFDDNNLYSTCINGGYYSKVAMEVLTEALEGYPVDGLFFNWFGNLSWDYQGRPIGLCHCPTCESMFREKYGRGVPDEADEAYKAFIYQSAVDVATRIGDLIHEKRPKALFMTYIEQATDVLVTEADFSIRHPLPQWIYSASEQVNCAMNTRPDKMIVDLIMPYEELRYRFASTPAPGLKALLYQNLAHGTFPAYVLLGTMDQPDRSGLKAVRPVFQYYDTYKQEYLGQQSAARVILYARQEPSSNRGSGDYRGLYRLLSELHVPFKATNRITGLSSEDVDLIVLSEGPVPDELRGYVERGGKVLVTGTTHPGMGFGKTVKLWENTKSSYMRIDDHAMFPSLKDTWTLFWEGSYLELEPTATSVTLIPPGQFGPPDKVSPLREKTDKPGLIVRPSGAGRIAFVPWHIGDLYYRFSNDNHRRFVSDVIDSLLEGRQLKTDAHPSIEISVMKQPDKDRTVVHLVNLIGHSGTAFFEAVPMQNISIELKGRFRKAVTMQGQTLSVKMSDDGYTKFMLPELDEYAAVCLYP